MMKRLITLLCFLALAWGAQAATDRYIRPGAGGANDGTSWTDAYESWPPFPLVRDTDYYIASGSTLPALTILKGNAPRNATQDYIRFKKASATDHGGAGDWNAAWGVGHVTLSGPITLFCDDIIFDGNEPIGTYGFHFSYHPGNLIKINGFAGSNDGTSSTNVTMGGFFGSYEQSTQTYQIVRFIYAMNARNFTNYNSRWRYAKEDVIQFYRGGGFTSVDTMLDHVWVDKIDPESSVTAHIDCLLYAGVSGNNVVKDCLLDWSKPDGSLPSQMVFWDGKHGTTGGNFTFYGTVFVKGGPGMFVRSRDDGGFAKVDSLTVYNCTFYDISFGACIQNPDGVINGDGPFYIRNNLFVDVNALGNITGSHHGSSVHSHNTSDPSFGSVNADEVLPTATILAYFADYANKDFRLVSPTSAGANLGAPYNIDPNGVDRNADGVWDRGAYTFDSGSPPPQPQITSATNVTAENGKPFDYTISVQGGATGYGASNLPSGLTLSGNLISGIPSIASPPATQYVILLATNSAGFAATNLWIDISDEGATLLVLVTTNSQEGFVEFGEVLTNSETDITFLVTNAAAATTTLSGHATNISTHWQLIGNVDYVLAGNTGTNITVRYKPTAIGNHSGTVEFTGADGFTNTLDGHAWGIHTNSWAASAGLVYPEFNVNGSAINNTVRAEEQQFISLAGRAVYGYYTADAVSLILTGAVNAATTGSDSFYVTVEELDGPPVSPTHIWDVFPLTSGYEERAINRRGNANYPTVQAEFIPMEWNLAADTIYKIVFTGRELNTFISNITVQATGDAGPTTPAKAVIYTPLLASTDVEVNVDDLKPQLWWTVDANTDYSWVHLGLDFASVSNGNDFFLIVTANGPGLDATTTLYHENYPAYSTEWFWRVDTSNATSKVITEGDVWNFTTEAEPSPPPPTAASLRRQLIIRKPTVIIAP